LGDPDLAADAAQDVFVRAWRAMGRFRGEASLSTWLHRIALNVISDTAKRRARGPLSFSSLEANDEDAAEFDMPDTCAFS
jgi:RNA polymerase sigma-70 factor (ECF subfamily)